MPAAPRRAGPSALRRRTDSMAQRAWPAPALAETEAAALAHIPSTKTVLRSEALPAPVLPSPDYCPLHRKHPTSITSRSQPAMRPASLSPSGAVTVTTLQAPTHTVTVTGVSDALSHSTTVTLIVPPCREPRVAGIIPDNLHP